MESPGSEESMERGPAREAAPASPSAQTSTSQSSAPDAGARARKSAPAAFAGMEFPRHFTLPDAAPFDQVEWEVRSAVIGNEYGKVVFEQRDVEIPKFWSQQATNI